MMSVCFLRGVLFVGNDFYNGCHSGNSSPTNYVQQKTAAVTIAYNLVSSHGFWYICSKNSTKM